MRRLPAVATLVVMVTFLAVGSLRAVAWAGAAHTGRGNVVAAQPVPTTTATTPRPGIATTVRPGTATTATTTAAAPATQTRHVVPGWMWVLIGLSVFTNLIILGALLNNRLRPPPPRARKAGT